MRTICASRCSISFVREVGVTLFEYRTRVLTNRDWKKPRRLLPAGDVRLPGPPLGFGGSAKPGWPRHHHSRRLPRARCQDTHEAQTTTAEMLTIKVPAENVARLSIAHPYLNNRDANVTARCMWRHDTKV